MSKSKRPDVSSMSPHQIEKEIKEIDYMLKWGKARLQQLLQERQDRVRALPSTEQEQRWQEVVDRLNHLPW